jgi:hypothetical protein
MDPNAQTPPPPPPPPQDWAAPPVASAAKSQIMKIVVGVAAVALVVGGIMVFRALTAGPGAIIFTTTEPGVDFACNVGDQVDSVSSDTEVWMVINFRDRMDDSRINVTVTKDGEDFDAFYYDDAEGYDCISEIEPFSGLEPGVYKFTAEVGDRIEAEGSLTIK